MSSRTPIASTFRRTCVAAALALTALPSVVAAAETRAPAPSAVVLPAPMPAGHTTIAPFPIPGDSAADKVARARLLNVPKPGLTTVAPLPPPAPSGPGAVDEPGPQRRLRVLDRPVPEYPKDARDAGVQGTVWVRAHVLASGMVREAKAVRGPEPLRQAAEESVRRWRFEPSSRNGQAAPMWVIVPVRFTLH